jgi:endonuclease III
VAAARKVVSEYGGDAGSIWAGQPSAAELAGRLRTFRGIGQKKAAMAVEILARDLGAPIAELSGSDIAFDVHVRRVFLRTRLIEYDDLDHIVDVARRLHPERPGELDFPAWLIGRQWCGAGIPNCAACALRDVCPRDVDRASAVRSS